MLVRLFLLLAAFLIATLAHPNLSSIESVISSDSKQEELLTQDLSQDLYEEVNSNKETKTSQNAEVIPTSSNSRFVTEFDSVSRFLYVDHAMNMEGMNMSEMEMEMNDEEVSHTTYQYNMAHGIIEAILWGFFAEFASYFPRYFRSWKYYTQVHSLIFWVIWLINTVLLITMLIYDTIPQDGYEAGDPNDVSHSALGISILILANFQQFGGGFLFQVWKNFRAKPDKVKFLKNFHRIHGYFLLLLTKANLLEGVVMWRPQYYPHMWGLVGFTFFVRIVIELIYQFKIHQTSSKVGLSTNVPSQARLNNLTPDQRALLGMVEKRCSLQEIKNTLPKMQWCMYGNKVLDCTRFLHPGGNYIIGEAYGREIMRYILGGHGLETIRGAEAHKHTSYALKALEELVIGEIEVREVVVDGVVATPASIPSWALARKDQINDTIVKFTFKAEKIQILDRLPGLGWMGKHWAISTMNNPTIKRLYSNVLCMSEDNIRLRQEIINYFDDFMAGKETNAFNKIPQNDSKRNELPLYIKRYDNRRSFSKMIHNVATDQTFIIEGLFGRGLELNETAQGTHVILTVGTGIFPFLDLLNFMLMKTIYEIIKSKDPTHVESINIDNQPYDKIFHSSFNILLIAAVDDEKGFVGLDIVRKLAEINTKYKLNSFRARVRKLSVEYLERVDDQKFDIHFLRKQLPQEVEKVYVCGPQDFCSSTALGLQEILKAQEKIIIM